MASIQLLSHMCNDCRIVESLPRERPGHMYKTLHAIMHGRYGEDSRNRQLLGIMNSRKTGDFERVIDDKG
jgi:hypothetical protein